MKLSITVVKNSTEKIDTNNLDKDSALILWLQLSGRFKTLVLIYQTI
jgi:hypothetical protein